MYDGRQTCESIISKPAVPSQIKNRIFDKLKKNPKYLQLGLFVSKILILTPFELKFSEKLCLDPPKI